MFCWGTTELAVGLLYEGGGGRRVKLQTATDYAVDEKTRERLCERTAAVVGCAVRVGQIAGRLPRSVVVERKTFLARVAVSVVLADTHQTSVGRLDAFFAVQVAPAAAAPAITSLVVINMAGC